MRKAERSSRHKVIAVVLCQESTALHIVGVIHAMGAMARRGYRHVAVAAANEAVHTDTPLQFLPAATFNTLPSPSGLIIPGSGQALQAGQSNDELLDYVRQVHSGAEFVVALGSGALVLAAAGLLQDLEATTDWACRGLLERYGARYVHRPWVETGKIFTAAGLTAGVDLGLHLSARYAGQAAARMTQLFMEYSPEPPFGAIDWQRAFQESHDSAVDG